MGLVRMGPPVELIKKLVSEFAVKNFVETGTYEGSTTVWASKHFEKVYTIEKSEHFYQQTRKKYEHLENIDFIYGDSRNELKKLVNKLDGATLFWLDAHWSGGKTYGDTDQCPLIEEIEIINDSRFDNFILIDDARLFTSPPHPPHQPKQWSDITSIIKTLNIADNKKYVVIIEDVIIAVPISAKASVTEYCQDVNMKLWNEYSQQNAKSNFRKGLGLIYSDLPTIIKKPTQNIINIFKNKRR